MAKPAKRRTDGAPDGDVRDAPIVRARDARGCFLPTGVTQRPERSGGGGAACAAAPKSKVPARPARPGRGKAKTAARWSDRREKIFLSALAETANIAGSARAAGVSETTVYRKRQASEAFRAAWAVALREGVAKLEMMLLHRAMNGVRKEVWHGGRKVGTMREYSERLALSLLAMHRDGASNRGGQGRPSSPPIPIVDLRIDLKEKLSEMNKKMGGSG